MSALDTPKAREELREHLRTQRALARALRRLEIRGVVWTPARAWLALLGGV